MNHLFKLNNKGILEIDLESIALYKPIGLLIKRDKEIEINCSPNVKHISFKEINYVYQVSSYKSSGNIRGLSLKELKKEAKELTGLPNEWEEDDKVVSAINCFKQHQDTIAVKAVLSLRSCLNISLQLSTELAEYNQILISNFKQLDTADREVQYLNFIDRNAKLSIMIGNMTKDIKALDEAESLLRKEEIEQKKGRSGINITHSMEN